jgi:hypothetical protein
MSIASAQFQSLAGGYLMLPMQTVAETRRQRLAMLVARFGDSLAQLNEALGLDRTDATLSQIRTQAKHSKTGKPRAMGDDLARKIEERLELPEGWMDTPPDLTYKPNDERIRRAMEVMESMPGWQVDQAVKIIDTLAEPADKSNGTTD